MEHYLNESRLEFTRVGEGKPYRVDRYPSEVDTHDAFDANDIAHCGNEHTGTVRIDLIVNHREHGDLTRRSIYITTKN